MGNLPVVLKWEQFINRAQLLVLKFLRSVSCIYVPEHAMNILNWQAAVLKEEFNIDLRVMGITGSRTMVLSDM